MKFAKPAFAGILLASSLALAGTAHAEPFHGPYVGAQVGWTKDKIGTLESDLGALGVHRSNDAFSGGIFAGYDYKVSPNFVIGAEAGFNMSTDDEVVRRGDPAITVNPKHAFDLTARAGYLVTDNTLLYARGGYNNLRAKTTVAGAGAPMLRDTQTYDGWLAGGGIERALGDNVSTRLEYRYSDLSGGGGGKFDRHQVLLGVAYRF